MINKQSTPEKELLNLIEQKKGSFQTAILNKGDGLFSLNSLKARFIFLKNKIKSKKIKEFTIDIKLINNFLRTGILILAGYLIYTITVSFLDIRKDFNPKIVKEVVSTPITLTPTLKSLGYYLEKVRKRDIFNMETKKLSSDTLTDKGLSSKIIEATKNFKLVGISWGPDPDVIIEDTVNKRTFFLKRGQLIDNKIRLKAIFKDKVILRYAGEEIELR